MITARFAILSRMPEMGGYETARRIRDPRTAVPHRNIPIIAMTAYAIKGDREKCLEAGMNDYITKPVDSEKLALLIEKWLTTSEAHNPLDDWTDVRT